MHTKTLLIVTVAVLALAGISATLAQAAATLPNILPEGTAASPITASATSGASTFGSSVAEISSSKSKGTAEANSLKLGWFQVALEETKNTLTGVKCTGLSSLDGTGVILMQGTFHIRDYHQGSTLRVAVAFLYGPIHFSCGPLLFIEEGCIAADLFPLNLLTKTLTVTLAKGTGNDNQIITILNEEDNKEEACQALFATGGSSTFALGDFVTTQSVTGFKQNGTEITILVMPL